MKKYVQWGGGGGQEFQLIGSGCFRGGSNKGTKTFLPAKREMGRALYYAYFMLFFPPPAPPISQVPRRWGVHPCWEPRPLQQKPSLAAWGGGSWSCTRTDPPALPCPAAGLHLKCSMERGRNKPLKDCL